MGEPSLDDANVKVAVRVRPMNRRGESASQLIVGLLLMHKHSNYCCNADCIFPNLRLTRWVHPGSIMRRLTLILLRLTNVLTYYLRLTINSTFHNNNTIHRGLA